MHFLPGVLYDDWKFGNSNARSLLEQSCPTTARFNRFNAVFESCKENFAVDLKGFRKILPNLRKNFLDGIDARSTNATSIQRRSTLIAGTLYPWMSKESIPSKIVVPVKIVLWLFPVKTTRFLGNSRQKEQNVLSPTDVIDSCINEHVTRFPKGCSAKRKAVETARAVYNKINPSFESACKMPLSAALINVQELNIEKKKSKIEKRKERRNNYRKSKSVTEAEWAKTDVVRYKLLLYM